MRNDDFVALFAKGKALFAEGKNVVEGLSANDPSLRRPAVEIAYSLQSGEYTRFALSEIAKATRTEGHRIVEPLLKQHGIETILDCGAGEGTRWLDFAHPTRQLYCLDASYNRLVHCQRNLRDMDTFKATTLIKGNMTHIPFAAGSVDAVFTCHAIEPNTDEDAERIIGMLFSIARKLVVIMEPNYRDAEPKMKARMEQHGYARNIWDVALAQTGLIAIAEGTLENVTNPLNRTSFLIMLRETELPQPRSVLCSPVDQSTLHRFQNMWVDHNKCFAFPVLQDIHCLAPEDGVFVGCQPHN